MKSSPNNKLGSVYKALFNCEFPAHDALEDVKALRRILFSQPLEASSEIIANRGKTCLPNEALEASTFLERRQIVVETYSGKLYLPNGSLKLTTIQKLADAGLAFSTLQEIYTKSTVCMELLHSRHRVARLLVSSNQVAENHIKQKNNLLSVKLLS